jgi:hypothetical protein
LPAWCARLIWRKRQGLIPVLDLRETLTDFLAAAAFVPFLLMLGTAFSDVFVRELLSTSKGAIWMAGGVDFIYLLKELLTNPRASEALRTTVLQLNATEPRPDFSGRSHRR